jgi:transposase
MDNRDARSLPAAAQEEIRRRAVHAVLVLGKKKSEVAKLLGVTSQAVRNWLKAHAAGGHAALRAQKRGRRTGEKTRISAEQARAIADLVRDRCPDQLKLPFYLWTREAVAKLIEQRFGVVVSLTTAGRYLATWGFTPQKPARRAYQQDQEAVRHWLEEGYPAIRAEAKREGAQIQWCDESGMRSDHTAGRTYSPRGKTPVVKVTGKRFGCSMISALNNQGRLAFMIYCERFTAQVFIKFLRRLLRQNPKKVFLIIDNHPVHHSKAVKNWVKEREDRLKLFYLPSYSPELNPDELVNQDVKSNAVGRNRARDVKELIANVRAFLRGKRRRPDLVKRYFLAAQVAYAAQTV